MLARREALVSQHSAHNMKDEMSLSTEKSKTVSSAINSTSIKLGRDWEGKIFMERATVTIFCALEIIKKENTLGQ